ncbi:hypothetical protein KM043_015566 [Ampulex compressa]|nr:hypothetical protein KM043_015566 [Ampulex compressa]
MQNPRERHEGGFEGDVASSSAKVRGSEAYRNRSAKLLAVKLPRGWRRLRRSAIQRKSGRQRGVAKEETKEAKQEEEEEEEEEEGAEEGICSSGANYVNENGERIASVQ